MNLAPAPTDDLRLFALKVGTALHESGTVAVLTGGSAATVYAPDVCQSHDADFLILQFANSAVFEDALRNLGFEQTVRIYRHPLVPFTLDFPDSEILIGSERVTVWEQIVEDELQLNILSPTDCVRDRLCHFYWYNDRSALRAAVAVTRAQRRKVDLETIREWSEREGESAPFLEFRSRVKEDPD